LWREDREKMLAAVANGIKNMSDESKNRWRLKRAAFLKTDKGMVYREELRNRAYSMLQSNGCFGDNFCRLDGTTFRSRYEVLLAFSLLFFKIPFLYEPNVFVSPVSGERYLPDFVLGKTVLEVKTEYRLRSLEKNKRVAEDCGYKFVVLGKRLDPLDAFYRTAYPKVMRRKTEFTFDGLCERFLYDKSNRVEASGKTVMLRHLECVRDFVLSSCG
jgi:hypothetical protein